MMMRQLLLATGGGTAAAWFFFVVLVSLMGAGCVLVGVEGRSFHDDSARHHCQTSRPHYYRRPHDSQHRHPRGGGQQRRRHHHRHQQHHDNNDVDDGNNWDPYRVLGIECDDPSLCTPDDLKRAYRAQCLVYHPDKNVHLPLQERKHREEAFKRVQQAYGELGDPAQRKLYDLKVAFARAATLERPSQSESNNHRAAAGTFYHQFYHYGAFGGGQSVPTYGFATDHHHHEEAEMQQQQQPPQPTMFSPFHRALSRLRSVYVQKVPVSLEDLYRGTTLQAHLDETHHTFGSRIVAAVRGGCGALLVYQAALYAVPMSRFLPGWMAIGWGACVFRHFLPHPPPSLPSTSSGSHSHNRHRATSQTPLGSYVLSVRPGYKGGTRFKFDDSSTRTTVVFVLYEVPHPLYRRVGNDLHATVTLSPTQARRGCTVRLPSLGSGGGRRKRSDTMDDDNDEPSIDVPVPPGYCPEGTQPLGVVIGRGWPVRKEGQRRGDLVVHVLVEGGAR